MHEMSVSWAWFKLTAMSRMQDALTYLPIWIGVLFNTGLQVIFFQALYLNTQSLAGWSFAEVMVLLGTFRILRSVQWGLWKRGGFSRLPRSIEDGTFDTILIRPINPRVQFIFNNADIFNLIEGFIIGGLLIWYGLSLAPMDMDWSMYFLLMVLACIIDYSILCLFTAINFWTLIPQMMSLFSEIDHLGRYPDSIYRGAVKWILMLAIPLVCIYSFPTRALIGNLTIPEMLITVAVAAVFWILASIVWKIGLRKYESAQG